jgi:hypothetical protein
MLKELLRPRIRAVLRGVPAHTRFDTGPGYAPRGRAVRVARPQLITTRRHGGSVLWCGVAATAFGGPRT